MDTPYTVRAEIRDCIGETIPLRRRWVAAIMSGPVGRLLARIETLETERDEAVDLAYRLKLAAAGGEDVPGSANLVTVEDVDKWRRETADREMRLESELDEERQESARLALLAVTREAERDSNRKALALAMQFVDRAAGEGLGFIADGDEPAMDAADVCFAVAAAIGIEDLDTPEYEALVARPAPEAARG